VLARSREDPLPDAKLQWNNESSAGFSDSLSTWLPVNPNYVWLNLADQESEGHESHLGVYKDVQVLRRSVAREPLGMSTQDEKKTKSIWLNRALRDDEAVFLETSWYLVVPCEAGPSS